MISCFQGFFFILIMLASSRISFETPNVVDPGDRPPSAPERSLQKDFANRGSRVNISPREEKDGIFKAPLSRTIKIDYTDDADEEPIDLLLPVDLDPEFGEEKEEPLSPGMEQTRLFAAAMLSESERRNSKRKLGFGIGSPVKNLFGEKPEETYLRDSLGLNYPMDKWRENRRRRCRRGLLITGAIAVLFTIFLLLIGKGQVTNRMTATKEFLTQNNYATNEKLSNPSTPQYKAALWIANEDQDNLDIPVNTVGSASNRFLQRYVLAVLYYSLGGDEWTQSFNFLSSNHECSWNEEMKDENNEVFAVGASCDTQLQVDSLLIPSNNLKGSIPDEIRFLRQLSFISLKHNELMGTLPSAMSDLHMLEYLDVKFNRLEGTIPEFLSNFQRLQVLGLSKNNFVGSLPGSFGRLRLKTLALDDNALTGDLVPLRLMSTLNYLYAQNNALQGNLWHGVMHSGMTSLVEVDLSGNDLTGIDIPDHCFSMPKLELLDVADNKLGGKFPDTIPDNVMLRYLSLRGNEMTSSIPDSISNLKQLTHLDLENNVMTGTLPPALSSMQKLQYLFLGQNSFQATDIPSELQNLVSLKQLSLNNLGLSGAIPSWITKLLNLSLLDLRENNLTGTLDIDFSKFHSMKHLMLHDNKLAGSLPKSLGTMKELQVLSIYRNALTGSANPVCDGDNHVYLIASDCSTITCDCCDKCCDEDSCYDSRGWDDLEETRWDQHYSRADYSFNPNILNGAQEPRDGSV